MKLANPKSKHIAKAAQGNTSTKALSKSLLFHPKKKKNLPCFANIKSAETQTDWPKKLENKGGEASDKQWDIHGRTRNHYPQHHLYASRGFVLRRTGKR